MKTSQLKSIIKTLVMEVLSEIEPDSPTGMSAVNVKETDQTGQKYYTIVSLQDYQDPEPMKLVKMKGPDAAIDYLAQWDSGAKSEAQPSTTPPWGSTDKTFDRGDYILYWNESLGYVGLVRVESPNSSATASADDQISESRDGVPTEPEEYIRTKLGEYPIAELRHLAYDYHGGQWSPLYAFASSGYIIPGLAAEATKAAKIVPNDAEVDEEDKLMAIASLESRLPNDELDEMTGTGAVAGFQTPYAFSRRGASSRAVSASTGYTPVKKSSSKNKQ